MSIPTRAALAGACATAVVVGLLGGPGAATTSASPGPDPDAASVSSPHEDSYYPDVGGRSIDVLHYDLRLRWQSGPRRLLGVADLRVRTPRAEAAFTLDLSDALDVASVSLDGRPVDYRHRGKDLVVHPGALAADGRHRLRVVYSGTPHTYAFPGTRSDTSSVGWTTTAGGQAWSMQEPYGAFTWYPSDDQPADKATYDVRLTTRADWHGVSGGRLLADRVHGGRRTTRFAMTAPVSSYLVTVAVGPYRRYTDTGPHGLPLTYWVRPGDRHLLPWLRHTPGMLAQLEQRLGRYPFDRAGAVLVPSDSAMETQTLVTMGDALGADREHFLGDLLHEYAHSWYGDTVTPRDWRDLWMNESFTMFDQIRWEIDRGWETETRWRRSLDANDAYDRREDGPPGAYKPDEFGSGSVYFSGARFLFALRDRLGEATFDRLLRAWPARHRHQSVTRAQWVRFLDRSTGRHLDAFVHRWLTSRRSPANPRGPAGPAQP